jgi:hypothetical protein
VFCKYFALCLCIFLCVSIFVKKKKVFALHCAFKCTLYAQPQIWACVQTHLRLFERSALF